MAYRKIEGPEVSGVRALRWTVGCGLPKFFVSLLALATMLLGFWALGPWTTGPCRYKVLGLRMSRESWSFGYGSF